MTSTVRIKQQCEVCDTLLLTPMENSQSHSEMTRNLWSKGLKLLSVVAQDFLLIPRSALTSWNSAQTIDGEIAWCLLSSSCAGAFTRLPVSTSLVRRNRLVHCVLVAAPEYRSSHWARPRPSPQCGSHLRVRLTVRACRCSRERPMVGDMQSTQGGFDTCQNNYFWCWKEVQVGQTVISNTHVKLPLLSCCVFGTRLQDSQSRVL